MDKKMKKYIVIIILGLIGFQSQAIHFPSFNQRVYEVPYAEKAPTIDGTIEPGEWKYAVKLPSGGHYVRQAEFMITWREEAIYVAQRSVLRPGEKPLCR